MEAEVMTLFLISGGSETGWIVVDVVIGQQYLFFVLQVSASATVLPSPSRRAEGAIHHVSNLSPDYSNAIERSIGPAERYLHQWTFRLILRVIAYQMSIHESRV